MTGTVPAQAADLRAMVAGLQVAEVQEVSNTCHASPVVSIVVPTFNHERYIAQCLDSILEQDLGLPFEILVGEDASTDGTRAICMAYASRHPDKIRLILHDARNKIRIEGRTTGRFNLCFLLSHARGSYVAWCEGDDYWRDPSKLRRQLDVLDARRDCVLAFTDSLVVDDAGLVSARKIPPQLRRDRTRQELALPQYIPTQSVLFHNVFPGQPVPRSFLGILNADTYILSFLAQFGGAVYAGDVAPCAYRVHEGGLWSPLDEVQRLPMSLRTSRALRELHSSPSIRRLVDARITRQLRSLTRLEWSRGMHKAAIVHGFHLFGRALQAPASSLPLLMESLLSRLPWLRRRTPPGPAKQRLDESDA